MRVVSGVVMAAAFVVGSAARCPGADVEFRMVIPGGVTDQTLSGRAIVYLIGEGSSVDDGAVPADGPFFDDPQPMFSVAVEGATSGTEIVIKSGQEGVVSFPVALAELPEGRYRVQAVLDAHRLNSSWKREPGNLYSGVKEVMIGGAGAIVELPLETRVGEERPRSIEGVEWVEVESRLLSEFRGERVVLRAGVLKPEDYLGGGAGARRYPAIYEVPGFGGDHTGVVGDAQERRGRPRDPLARQIGQSFFRIVLDPEGPNGHHLFVDSASNGPVGRALVEELVPELTRRFNLVDAPEGRLLRGHSSGGWSVLWLATEYPEVFGAAWASSPDPVDFRRFQLVDVYDGTSMYERATATGEMEDTPSYEDEQGVARMTIRQENLMEEVLGPGNTSGQQWDSWLAAFGPKGADGEPASLYDALTGRIDHTVAEAFRACDLGERLRAEPGRFGPVFRDRVRLIVGSMDNYALDEAVGLLRADLERLGFLGAGGAEGEGAGYVKIVPGLDHGSIFRSSELRGIRREMLDYLLLHAEVMSGR